MPKTPRLTILLVDDEPVFLRSLAERIELKGFDTVAAHTGSEALEAARTQRLHLAIVDQRMPDMDGLVTITKLKEIQPALRTVLLTGHGDEKLRQATDSLDAPYFEKDQMGRFWEFLQEFGSHPGMIIVPPTGGELPPSIEALAAQQTLERRRRSLFPAMGDAELSGMSKIVGESEAMVELKETISKVAALDCTVLILGETGTGKELVARTIHEASNRNRERFLAVNCGSFTPDLLSNELFGHEREAFTGASRGKQGVFEAASGGTIMLDEVGDTPPSMQVQLLRVLQEKTVTRVGGTTEIPVDVRVLAATNVSLKQRVKAGQFREDLYYRLNVFTVRIPPLRERADDVELLGSFFLNKYNRAFRKQVEGISEEVLGLLNAYHFPGNVRELENVIERAVIVCDGGLVLPRHLPERFRRLEAAASRTRTDFVSLAELERGYIRQVLEATGGNKSETAKILGINRASLWRKLKRYDEDDA
jgi:DNA-binding NtrC family response regulator